MTSTIDAIYKSNMVFVSAQPDEVYFHWQVEIYMYQFATQGIIDRCYAVFCHKGDEPSMAVKELQKKYRNIVCYKDERTDNHPYKPMVRPYVMKKFFKEFPELGKCVFYHDSDIFIVKLPKFGLMLKDDNGYVSDTVNYIGANYLKECSRRYKEKHPDLPDNDLFLKMCQLLDMPPDLVQSYEKGSGGAQYLLKNIDATYWEKVEQSTHKLFTFFKEYEKSHPIAHHVQSWATDMWTVLWEYWRRGNKTIVHTELDFSWATDHVSNYFKKNIFHLAGVNQSTSADKFYKGNYNGKNAIKEYLRNPKVFAHVSPLNATYEYVSVIKIYAETLKPKIVYRFAIDIDRSWGTVYRKEEKMFFDRPLWKSIDGNYTIFYNKSSWILTLSKYESDFSETCGGFASNNSDEPYENGWNTEGVKITIY